MSTLAVVTEIVNMLKIATLVLGSLGLLYVVLSYKP